MEEQSSAARAAQQVQSIVAAAEASAREIEQQARLDAAAHVEQVRSSIAALTDQAVSLRTRMEELEAVFVELRATVDGFAAEAQALGSRPAAAAEPDPAPDPPADEPAPAMAAAPVPEVAAEAEPDLEPDAAPEPEPAADSEPATAPESATAAPEGVRLVALNMALSGKPRDETARYLRENFEFDGADALLDEVYAKVGS